MPFAATFWETFFLFLIFLPPALIWGFALLDIGAAKEERSRSTRRTASW